jgi:hypothetical protein
MADVPFFSPLLRLLRRPSVDSLRLYMPFEVSSSACLSTLARYFLQFRRHALQKRFSIRHCIGERLVTWHEVVSLASWVACIDASIHSSQDNSEEQYRSFRQNLSALTALVASYLA